ncbi:12779_t:CDS:2, partial [Racocetra persica]
EQRAYRELITDPVIHTPYSRRAINHSVLPVIKDELSITLKIKVLSHGSSLRTVFTKGSNYTPSFILKPVNSNPCICFSIT